MFQPLGRFSDVAKSRSPIASPISASLSAVLLDIGIFCPDFHNRDHWPYCRRRWVFAALTTLARSSVLAASRAHTFLISPIHSERIKSPRIWLIRGLRILQDGSGVNSTAS